MSRWRVITFKADDALKVVLERRAREEGVSVSAVIRKAIMYYLSQPHEPPQERVIYKKIEVF